MSIVLEELTKRYGGHPVVNGVSLEVAEGELFVLLGSSGSGKSTLLRMIAGLSEVDAGRVLLHGRDVTGLPPAKRGVGFVFQSYALFRGMSVAENVEFALSIRSVSRVDRRRRRDELLEMVGLAGLGGRMPRQLSGGQQQRVALARALAHRPEVLLLDEPFGALDAKVRVDLRRTIREIQRELGITTVFVTHDQEEAFELADRLAVLSFGRLLEAGPPDELYLRPETEFVATFLGTANLMVGSTRPRACSSDRCSSPSPPVPRPRMPRAGCRSSSGPRTWRSAALPTTCRAPRSAKRSWSSGRSWAPSSACDSACLRCRACARSRRRSRSATTASGSRPPAPRTRPAASRSTPATRPGSACSAFTRWCTRG